MKPAKKYSPRLWARVSVHAIGGDDGDAFGQIMVIPKNGKPRLANEKDYRLMAMAPNLLKLLERIFEDREVISLNDVELGEIEYVLKLARSEIEPPKR